jgi:hypothetical protein
MLLHINVNLHDKFVWNDIIIQVLQTREYTFIMCIYHCNIYKRVKFIQQLCTIIIVIIGC